MVDINRKFGEIADLRSAVDEVKMNMEDIDTYVSSIASVNSRAKEAMMRSLHTDNKIDNLDRIVKDQ